MPFVSRLLWKLKPYLLSLPYILLPASAQVQSGVLSADSIEIAECFGVFAVAANYYMLQGNESAARLMGTKAAFTLAAFSFAEVDEKGEVDLTIFDEHQSTAKPKIEQNPSLLNSWPANCAKRMVEYKRRRVISGITVEGLSFDKFNSAIQSNILRGLGLM